MLHVLSGRSGLAGTEQLGVIVCVVLMTVTVGMTRVTVNRV